MCDAFLRSHPAPPSLPPLRPARPLREALGHDRWVLPLVHGFWQQRRLALFGRTLTLTLVARRSRQVREVQRRGLWYGRAACSAVLVGKC